MPRWTFRHAHVLIAALLPDYLSTHFTRSFRVFRNNSEYFIDILCLGIDEMNITDTIRTTSPDAASHATPLNAAQYGVQMQNVLPAVHAQSNNDAYISNSSNGHAKSLLTSGGTPSRGVSTRGRGRVRGIKSTTTSRRTSNSGRKQGKKKKHPDPSDGWTIKPEYRFSLKMES